MITVEKAQLALTKLIGKPRFQIMLETCALFTALTEQEGLRPVIVGGFAVEIYSRNEYTTVDIDMVFARWDRANELFSKLGFEKQGRHWFHQTLGISIEIPGDMLNLADEQKVIRMALPDGLFVYVIGIEDIILDRMRACVHWKSSSDCEWGYRLFLLHQQHLDLDYMKQKSSEDLTEDLLLEWKSRKPV